MAAPGSTPARPPSASSRLIAEPFWAGLLGASVFTWLLGIVLTLEYERLLPSTHGEGSWTARGAWLSLLVSILAAFALGYRRPLQSYAGLFGRLFGGLLFGGAAMF